MTIMGNCFQKVPVKSHIPTEIIHPQPIKQIPCINKSSSLPRSNQPNEHQIPSGPGPRYSSDFNGSPFSHRSHRLSDHFNHLCPSLKTPVWSSSHLPSSLDVLDNANSETPRFSQKRPNRTAHGHTGTDIDSKDQSICVGNLACNSIIKRSGISNIYVSLFVYAARTEEEISLQKDDTVAVLNDNDSDWWFVEHMSTGNKGYVPTAYIAPQGSVEAEDWYSPRLSRKDSERLLLLGTNPRGTFLIRQSETSQGALTLSVRDEEQRVGPNGTNTITNTVKHYRIRHFDYSNYYYITAKCGFISLQELVNYYSHDANGLCCRLTQACPRPVPITTDLSVRTKDHWEIPKNSIVLIRQLGAGQFGEVWLGKWNGTTEVAVKTLKHGTMTKDEFLKEARIMRAARHPKLVRLYAVCTEDPIYIVTELVSNGSLLHYLRDGPGKNLELNSLVDMMAQIADGMAYLEKERYIHRDLAARNILVGENNGIKIADFGLARVVEDHYSTYMAHKSTKFPIKWTAPEAALMGRFTIKSDVWSFGIVIYELITHGQVPYPSMDNTETLEQVRTGYRMPRPTSCPQPIYNMLLRMWDAVPERRPTFAYLFDFFEDYFVTSDTDYKHASNTANGTQCDLPVSSSSPRLPIATGSGKCCSSSSSQSMVPSNPMRNGSRDDVCLVAQLSLTAMT
ncbi:hypothetical protein EG68_10189 [Paragonimus skrjabini miyazakii]|uniref:Tyrosine-protein kinase n=1 Tax=Paragonimus skrjabini miyazakii TaxID=59628 RepID=A0A8S9YIZ4_9TREM|nr:hypothetical protein EG68_10189 [Paragonimus skrjabini miyazakii]